MGDFAASLPHPVFSVNGLNKQNEILKTSRLRVLLYAKVHSSHCGVHGGAQLLLLPIDLRLAEPPWHEFMLPYVVIITFASHV